MSVQTVGRVLGAVLVSGWIVLATLVGVEVFGSTHCVGHSGEPFWREWSGGRRVCGIGGPEIHRIVSIVGAVLALGLLPLTRRHTGLAFWARAAAAAVLPVGAYAGLRLVVALG